MNTEREKDNNKFKSTIFQEFSHKKNVNRCLWAESECKESAIKAHSIQNKNILDQLVDDNGKVIMLNSKLCLDNFPEMEFEQKGRNEATIFTGLCKKHDKQLFQPIDDYPFDKDNEKQKFLLAYRSVLKEYHSQLTNAQKIQKVYQNGIELGKFGSNNIDIPCLKATLSWIDVYEFYLHKQAYNQCYCQGNFKTICHKLIIIENRKCPLAVSSTFNITKNKNHKNCPYLTLNIFPHGQDTIIMFSYLKYQDNFIKDFVENITNKQGDYQLYLLSKIVLKYCENWVIYPKHFQTFSDEKICTIKSYYLETFKDTEYDDEDSNLFLF